MSLRLALKIAFLVCIVLILITAFPVNNYFHEAPWVRQLFGVEIAITGVTIVASEIVRKQYNRDRAAALRDSENPRSIGSVLSFYRGMPYFSPERRALRETLIRLISGLQASDPNALTQYQKVVYLLRSSDADMVLAILKAAEQIGGGEALPYVRTLAAGGWSAKTNREVREAAQHCQSILEARQ